MPEPYTECPRFAECSAPKCPLDPDVERRDVQPGEPKCTARRATREAIAAAHPDVVLPWRGLLPRERRRDAAKAAWDSLPADHPRKVALAAGGKRFGRAPADSAPENAR